MGEQTSQHHREKDGQGRPPEEVISEWKAGWSGEEGLCPRKGIPGDGASKREEPGAGSTSYSRGRARRPVWRERGDPGGELYEVTWERQAEASSSGPGKAEHGITVRTNFSGKSRVLRRKRHNVIHVFLFFFKLIFIGIQLVYRTSQVAQW